MVEVVVAELGPKVGYREAEVGWRNRFGKMPRLQPTNTSSTRIIIEQCGRCLYKRPCMFIGLTRSGSYFEGVKDPNTQETPQEVRKSYTNFQLYSTSLLYKRVLQTVLGMGMDMDVGAQVWGKMAATNIPARAALFLGRCASLRNSLRLRNTIERNKSMNIHV